MRHHTMLVLGKPTDHLIGTLMTFDVHRTFKVISVGHADQDDSPYCHGARSVTTRANGAPIAQRPSGCRGGAWSAATRRPSYGWCSPRMCE